MNRLALHLLVAATSLVLWIADGWLWPLFLRIEKMRESARLKLDNHNAEDGNDNGT